MERPRKPGEIVVEAELAALLSRLRSAAAVDAPADLDLTQLRAVEMGIGSRFGDDLLAVFAAHLPALEDQLEWRLGLVVGHTGQLHQLGGRGDLVALGHRERRQWYCVEMPPAEGRATRVIEYDAQARSTRRFELAEWLARELPDPAGVGEPPPLQPRLVARALESTAAGRRVRHAKFGQGTVLAESGTGPTRKVKAEFPGRGLVVLQARFLEFLDD